MESSNKKENSKKIAIIILIIIIIILLLLIFCLLRKDLFDSESNLIPTGNVDIFDIECNKNCDCNSNTVIDQTDSTNDISRSDGVTSSTGNVESSDNTITNSSSSGGVSNNDTNSSQSNGNVEVYDSNTVWQSTNRLKIFENPVYQMDSVIAPTSSNSYQFVIKNSTSFNVNYNLEFVEDNSYSINMKYKLKKNGNYVVGDNNNWVSYDNLNLNSIIIKSNSSDTYYLEWKWIESDNDTEIGAIGSYYKLSINLSAKQEV